MEIRSIFMGLNVHTDTVDVSIAEGIGTGRSATMASSRPMSGRWTRSGARYRRRGDACISS